MKAWAAAKRRPRKGTQKDLLRPVGPEPTAIALRKGALRNCLFRSFRDWTAYHARWRPFRRDFLKRKVAAQIRVELSTCSSATARPRFAANTSPENNGRVCGQPSLHKFLTKLPTKVKKPPHTTMVMSAAWKWPKNKNPPKQPITIWNIRSRPTSYRLQSSRCIYATSRIKKTLVYGMVYSHCWWAEVARRTTQRLSS